MPNIRNVSIHTTPPKAVQPIKKTHWIVEGFKRRLCECAREGDLSGVRRNLQVIQSVETSLIKSGREVDITI